MLDLAALSREEAARRMDAALRRFGFFYVSNHGVPQELIDSQCVSAVARRSRAHSRRSRPRSTPQVRRRRLRVRTARQREGALLLSAPAAARRTHPLRWSPRCSPFTSFQETMPFDPHIDIGYQRPGSQQLDANGVPVHGDTKEACTAVNRAPSHAVVC